MNSKSRNKGLSLSFDFRRKKREAQLKYLAKFRPMNIEATEFKETTPKFAKLHFGNSHSIEVLDLKEMKVVMALRDVLRERREKTIGLIKFWELKNLDLPRNESFEIVESLVNRNALFKKPAKSMRGYFRYGFVNQK